MVGGDGGELLRGGTRAERGLPLARPRTFDPRRLRFAVHPDDPEPLPMPESRSECRLAERPCPILRCRWHLFLDVTPEGTIKFNFPHLLASDGTPDLDGMPETCALDVAEEGEHTLEEVGALVNLTRERVRQCEQASVLKLRRRGVRLRVID